ncbi:MAG TPA: sulfotransferase [Anaerolineales bacterium]|nr:sulfotransferase [Anaerolineales bacterium]
MSLSTNKMLFIIGAMRSGTTLLAETLDLHPEIVHCPFELRDIWSKYGGVSMASPKTKDRFCCFMDETNQKPYQAQLISDEFNKRYKKHGRFKNKNAYFLNKNPHLCNKIRLLKTIFPESYIIWIMRDMYSVIHSLSALFEKIYTSKNYFHYWPEASSKETFRCFSCFDKNFVNKYNVRKDRLFPGGNMEYLAEYWLESNLSLADYYSEHSSSKLFRISEEELIAEPHKKLSEICDFLAINNNNFNKNRFTNWDLSRNDKWKKSQTENDKKLLSEFIIKNIDLLNKISPNLAKEYQHAISY